MLKETSRPGREEPVCVVPVCVVVAEVLVPSQPVPSVPHSPSSPSPTSPSHSSRVTGSHHACDAQVCGPGQPEPERLRVVHNLTSFLLLVGWVCL